MSDDDVTTEVPAGELPESTPVDDTTAGELPDDTVTVPDDSATADGDGGAAQVQAKFDEAHAKGYFGETPDPHPNEAYSLQSGPDSPGGLPDDTTRA